MPQFQVRIDRLFFGAAIALLLGAASARPVAAQNFRHCGEVNRNETWTAQDAHYIECDVRVRNSKLTVAEGVQIQMDEGVSLIIESGASIEVLGEPDARVRIAPNSREEEAGFWGQIRFEPGAEESRIQNAVILGGGREGLPMLHAGAVVRLVSVDLRLAADVPLSFDADVLGPSLEEAGQNTAQACELVKLNGGQGSHGRDGILVEASIDLDVTVSQDWYNFCVPYLVEQELAVAGEEAPTLWLRPGTELRFGPEASLRSGFDELNLGQIEVSGDEGRPVILRGMDEGSGSWKGIRFTEHYDPVGSNNALYDAIVRDGGSAERAMVEVRSPLLTRNPVFQGAPGYPVDILASETGGFLDGLSALPESFVDNGVQRILVRAGDAVDIAGLAEWRGAGVPLEIDDDLLVAGGGATAGLTLSDGAHLAFREGKALVIGDELLGIGDLSIKGLRGRPVTLEGLEARPGAWRGLVITDWAGEIEIEELELGYGGSAEAAMLEWGDAEGTLFSSRLHHAAGLPLRIAVSQLPAVAEERHTVRETQNRFEQNAVQAVGVRMNRFYQELESDWYSPGLPLHFDETLTIGADSEMLLRIHGGIEMRFAPEAGFQVGNDLRKAAVELVGDAAGDGLRLGPIEEGGTWAGARVVAGASLTGRGLQVSGRVPDSAAALGVEDASLSLQGLAVHGVGEGTGLRLSGAEASATLRDARFTDQRIGIHVSGGAVLDLAMGEISGQSEWGLLNDNPAGCARATLVYWGSEDGPNDPSGARDGCMNEAHAGGGSQVSDRVTWRPFAVDEAYTPSNSAIYLPMAYRGAPAR